VAGRPLAKNIPFAKVEKTGKIGVLMKQKPEFFEVVSPTGLAAATGFLGVVLGAFGAHGLRELLTQLGTTAIWEKAVFYHLIHAVMLFFLAERKPWRALAWWSFFAGIVCFSGSLYLLAVTNMRWLGAVTPLGGVSFLVGWGALWRKGAGGGATGV